MKRTAHDPAISPLDTSTMRDRRLQVLAEIKFLLCVLIALAVLGVFLIAVHR